MNGDALSKLFAIHDRVWKTNLEGIGHEESLIRPAPAGNCINWVAGHVVAGRNAILGLVARDPVWTDETARIYARGASLGDPARAEPFESILAMWDRSQAEILKGLAAMDPESFAAARESDVPGDTVAEQLAFFQFHEAYHLGQLGLQRRLVGKPGGIS